MGCWAGAVGVVQECWRGRGASGDVFPEGDGVGVASPALNSPSMFCRFRVFGSTLKRAHFAFPPSGCGNNFFPRAHIAAELEDKALAHKLTEGR